eukprot:GILJ01015512.1.p1 GENE.GILJ01015512.1~~GILJ01015512.1.p1  ORF type:complete len:315 (-),score=25.80 GILJ01015512.1:77-1021(-)
MNMTTKKTNSIDFPSWWQSRTISSMNECTAFDLYRAQRKEQKLSLGCPILDNVLKGGIPPQGITEIAGQAGSGKTQFALQLLLQAQLPAHLGGLSGSTFYLSTEGSVPFKRLQQLAESYEAKTSGTEHISFLENIFIENVHSLEHQWDILSNRIPLLMESMQIKLVVIDSIASLFRVEFDHSRRDMRSRSDCMTRHASLLKRLSSEYRIPIVVTNQVADIFHNEDASRSHNHHTASVAPALGLAWSNCIDHRLFLSRKDMGEQQHINPGGGASVQRRLDVTLSPSIPNSSCYYAIDAFGVHGIPDVPYVDSRQS